MVASPSLGDRILDKSGRFCRRKASKGRKGRPISRAYDSSSVDKTDCSFVPKWDWESVAWQRFTFPCR